MSIISRPVNRGVYPVNLRQTRQLASATLRYSNLLAVGALIFGAACAAFIPASLEQRLGTVFFFGLMPAVAFHGGGFVLSLALEFSMQFCERAAALGFRYLARLIGYTGVFLRAPRGGAAIEYLSLLTRDLLCKTSEFASNASRSAHRGCRRAETAMLELSCLAIRNTARFIIRVQDLQHSTRYR
jgi:hypothetical protein